MYRLYYQSDCTKALAVTKPVALSESKIDCPGLTAPVGASAPGVAAAKSKVTKIWLACPATAAVVAFLYATCVIYFVQTKLLDQMS